MDGQSKKKIRELADLLSELGLGEIEVRSGDQTIRVAARSSAVNTVAAPVVASSVQPQTSSSIANAASRSSGNTESSETQYDEAKLIRSPFVGTYYESPAPGSDAFIKIGQQAVSYTHLTLPTTPYV